jgi:glucose/arabinose dehydrogenase
MAAVLAATSCTGEPAGEAAPAGTSPGTGDTNEDTGGDAEVVVDGLEAPWSLTFHGDTPLVSERDTARILELDDSGAREVATVTEATPGGEGGLLGIAAHDDHLYVYYTASGENRIERHELTGQPGALGLGPPETVLDGLPAAAIHNGGRIAFGPDGMLYATVGDADEPDSAQDLDSLAGKILRMGPEGQVPVDNPFEGSLVYSYGHRNPQGIAWAADGTLYASELGQDTWDELNIIEPGGNYGWPAAEGAVDREGFVDPVQQWPPADASPSGIAVTDDAVHIANLRGERLRDVPLTDHSTSTVRFSGDHGRLRDVVIAPDGALWLLTNNTDGRGAPAPDDDRILRVPAS